MKRLFLILALLAAAFPASASVMQIRDASGTVTDVTSANPLPVDATVSIGSLTISANATASAGVNDNADDSLPVCLGISNTTNIQKLLPPIMLADGVNGNNMLSIALWGYNGTAFDRIRTSSGAIEIKIASLAEGITLSTGGPTGYATDPVNVSGALSFTFDAGSATAPAYIFATQSRVVSGSFQSNSATSTSVLPTLFPLASPTMPATVVVTCNVGECWLGATGLTATGSIVASQGFKLQAGQSVSYDYFTGFDLTVCADTDETADASVTTAIYPRK